MPFFPALFANFNKEVDDLNEPKVANKFNFSNRVVVKRNTGNGLSVSTTATFDDSISGEVEAVYKSSDFGKLTVNQQTDGAVIAKAKLTTLADNLTVNVEGYSNVSYQNNGDDTLKVSAQYLQDQFTVDGTLELSRSITTSKDKKEATSNVNSSVVLKASGGSDGFSVGGVINLNPQGENKVGDYDAGFRYEQDNFNFNVQTAKKGQKVNAGYFHRISNIHQFGLFGSLDRSNNARTLTLLNDYDLDSNTCTRVSLDTTGVARVALEHSLADPRVRVNVAQQLDFKGNSKFTASKFGLGLTFGDY
jgi:hypothetical protein